MGLSTDGFALWCCQKYTAWPIILFNYNLGLELQNLKENIISVGVIPGPKKPHGIDLFLYPLVEELLCLACGICAYNAFSQELFLLCAYLIVIFGDIPAISILMNMKGHNAIAPC